MIAPQLHVHSGAARRVTQGRGERAQETSNGGGADKSEVGRNVTRAGKGTAHAFPAGSLAAHTGAALLKHGPLQLGMQ